MAADNTQGPLQLGGKFLKYTVRGLLGRGGHAWVYEGHDQFLDYEVAIKILHRPGGVTRDMLRRGQAEAKLLYRLKHQNIVDVLDAGITEEGLLYIVMELLRGDTLRELTAKKGRLALADALPLFAKISDGVEAAHAFKAIHRDLKPENIFVLDGYEPKVLDFGIAKVVDAAGWTTEKDIVHGTVLYMSPEQLNGETATARSDVYALGLTMFEALYGRHPLLLKNQRPTVPELTWMHHSVRPPRLDQLDETIPRYVARLVEWMLFKAPDRRVASMAECGRAIRECMARLTGDSGVEFKSVSLVTDASDISDATHPADATSAANLQNAEPHDTVRIEPAPFPADESVTIQRGVKAPLASNKTDRVEPHRELRSAHAPATAPQAPAVRAAQAPAVVATARPQPASARRALTPGTVPPVTTGVAAAARRRSTLSGEDPHRRLMLRLLAVSSLVGAALGGGYLRWTGRSASRPSVRAESNDVTIVALPPTVASKPAAPAPANSSPPPDVTAAAPASSASAPTVAVVPAPGAARAVPPVSASRSRPVAAMDSQRRSLQVATPSLPKPTKHDDDLWVGPASGLDRPLGPAPRPERNSEQKTTPKPHQVDITTPILE